MSDAFEIHKWVAEYNWDDGLAPLWPIAKNDETEFATAIMIYWRLDGPWFASPAGKSNDEAKRLRDFVEARLLAGQYPKTSLRYDPIADNGLSKTQVYKLKNAGVPKELIEPEYPDASRQP